MSYAKKHYKDVVSVWTPSSTDDVFGQTYVKQPCVKVELIYGGSLGTDQEGNEFSPKKTLFSDVKIPVGAKIAVGATTQGQPSNTAEVVRSADGAKQLRGHWEWVMRTG